VIALHQELDLPAAIFTHGALWDQDSNRGVTRAVRLMPLLTEKCYLDAHVRKNSRVQFDEGNPHLNRGFLTIGRRNHRTHLAGYLPIGIRIQQIGRASCRERAYTWVGAAWTEKKQGVSVAE